MALIHKINLAEKLTLFSDHWNPRIAGELNGQQIKLAKIQGEFVWHSHADEDEFFMVLQGWFNMELRDQTIHLAQGDCIIIPKGVEHRPVAPEECHILLFEPAATQNTGNTVSELTRTRLDQI